MHTVLTVAMIFIFLFALTLFMILPSRGCEASRKVFMHRNIAHRGLHSADNAIPENSLPAFQAAVDAKYGIEFDLQLSKDEQIVIYHDDKLTRGCGLDKRVEECTFDELQQLSLFGTSEKIPLFTDVLKIVDGKVPLVIELKQGTRNGLLCQKALEILRSYKGEYCIESFNPLMIAWFRKNAPDIMRGVLSGKAAGFKEFVNSFTAFLLSHCLINFLARPHFIAYHVQKSSPLVKLADKLGAMRFVWTANPSEDIEELEHHNDTVIFENYLPHTKF